MTDPGPHDFSAGQVINGRLICGAKSRAGTPCQQRPLTGRTRCRLHGGKSLRGIASPSFKDGRHSRFLPKRLIDRYAAGLDDPDLLELRPEIALLDAHLSELLDALDIGSHGDLWDDLGALWDRYQTAVREGDRKSQQTLIPEIAAVVETGADVNGTWRQVVRLMEQRRKMVETEQRRLTAAQQMVTVEQTLALMTAYVMGVRTAVERHVGARTFRQIMTDVSLEFDRFSSVK